MFVYLLPVHLSLLIFGLVISENSTNITVKVSVNGSDTPSCIQSNKSCKTMMYVLDRISHMSQNFHQNTSITVNITCNQIIERHGPYKFTSSFPLSVRLVGHNDVNIVFKQFVSLVIFQEVYSEFNWAWIGFAINFTSHLPIDITSDLRHFNVNFLTIHNCKIMAITLSIINAHNVVIDSTEFVGTSGRNSLCPSIIVTTMSHSTSFTISNSKFSTCTSINYEAVVIFDITIHASTLTIIKCTFTEVIGNHPADKLIKLDPGILLVKTQKDITFVLTINESCFIRNSKIKLLTVKALPEMANYHVSVILHGLDIINNTATSALVEINRYTLGVLGFLAVNLSNLLVDTNNVGSETDWSQALGGLASSVFSFSKVTNVVVKNLNFTNNHGTSLAFKSVEFKTSLFFVGNNIFSNNTGVFGGACNIQNVVFQRDEGTVMFENNKGIYGGALYLANITLQMKECKLKLKFIGNKAVTSGNSVYFATSPQDTIQQCPFKNISLVEVNSLALNMTQAEETVLQLMPGQNIFINVSITDYFGNPSSCIADVYLLCNDLLYGCFDKQLSLNGPGNVVLVQTDITAYTVVDTKLSISAPPQMLKDIAVSLKLICRNNAQIKTIVPLNISSCPLGFVYNETEGVCKCGDITRNHGTVICSETLGIACVTQGYWYGPFNNTNRTVYVSAPCSFPECSYSYKPCPAKMLSLGFAGDYKLLGFDADEQCSVGRGGLLCKSCAADYRYTFLSVSCVASSTCQWWQPYLILVITLVFQVMIAMTLLLVVRFKIAVGSGFLYGPMLFLAIISHFPLDIDPNFFILRTSILIITAVPLLNPEPFGLIPWCFFHPFNKIYNYSLRYLGPLTVLLVIGFTTLKARWCPRTLLKWQNSRLRALCILMLLSFWSLADITMNITFNILTSTRLLHNDGVESSVVALEPHMKYFSLEHIPIVILALLVLLIVIGPLLVVLLISPALSRVMNLTRIKPFLDEFQSCYKDNCRWYSTLYFIVWIGFVSMQSQSVPAIYILTLFMILLSTHCLIRPYQSKILNIMDALILVDINFLLALTQFKTTLTTLMFVHMLALGPILCVGVWFVGVFLIKCGICRYLRRVLVRKRQQPLASREPCYEECLPSPPNVPVQEVYLSYENNNEREPLIGIVDDN